MLFKIKNLFKKIRFEYKIGFIYAIIGFLWIYFSDWIIDSLVSDKQVITKIQTFKGSFYVIVTSFLLFYLLKRYMKKLHETQMMLKQRNDKIESQNEEYKHLNDQLFIAKEKAEENDQLKTSFLQNISHEIRTPMNAIVGFSGFLDKDDITEEKRRNFINIIQSSSQQLLSIVTNILTISFLESKQEKVNIASVNINNMMSELYEIFRPGLNRKVKLVRSDYVVDNEIVVSTDKTKLTQILVNLISNAIKFTSVGKVEFGYKLNGDYMEFYVKDTGIGIKKELQEKIFERFRQADRSIQQNYGGTGLGLSIAKGFAELLGGKIRVNSEMGKGSTFSFTIPYKPVVEHSVIQNNYRKNKEIVNGKNEPSILVAEDDEFNYLYLKELLNESKLGLIHAATGQEAVDMCKSHRNIKIILMDIKLPVLDGFNATAQIKELYPGIPVIAQSAYALKDEKERYEKVFDDYLAKPINRSDLNQILKKYNVL